MSLFLSSFGDFLKNAGSTILYILIFIVVLGLIIGIHEFGHMIFARRAGILCREYAIGMGPKLWSKRKGEIVYSLRAFPIGGFCSIAGETVEEDPFKGMEKIKLNIVDGKIIGFYLDVDDEKVDYPIYKIGSYDIFDKDQTGKLFMEVIEDENSVTYPVDAQAIIYQKKEEFQIAPYNRTLASKNKRQRALVMFGGPLMNFVLAIVIFFIIGLITGFTNTKSNALGEVSEGTTVSDILQKDDKIVGLSTVTLGNKTITSWIDLTDYMDEYDEKHLAEKIIIKYERDGQTYEVTATPFIAINNAGFGSDYDYDIDSTVIVGAFSDISGSNLGDNSQIKLGDTITSIWVYNGTPINNPTWSQIREIFDNIEGDNKDENYNKVFMKVIRKDTTNEIEISVTPYSQYLMENQTSLNGGTVTATSSTIGISPSTRFSLVKSIGYAFERTWGSITAVVDTFKLLFRGSVSITNLSGPIGIYSITKSAAQYGIMYVLSLVGLLSVNIGALNLLPIPALDGGRLVFVAYEAITKKKPNPKVETILITITMILLLALMVVVAYEDILRLFN